MLSHSPHLWVCLWACSSSDGLSVVRAEMSVRQVHHAATTALRVEHACGLLQGKHRLSLWGWKLWANWWVKTPPKLPGCDLFDPDVCMLPVCLPRVFLWSPRDKITGNLPEDLNPALPSIFFLKLGSPSVYLDHSCPPWKYPRLPND